MQTIKHEEKKFRIKGPAGYLYVDAGGKDGIPVVFDWIFSFK